VKTPHPLRSIDRGHLGCYELAGRLGEGGQGVVYLGRTPDGQKVAIKVLRASPDEDQRARRRFEVEAIPFR
jgi:serine/threonine protein kinase